MKVLNLIAPSDTWLLVSMLVLQPLDPPPTGSSSTPQAHRCPSGSSPTTCSATDSQKTSKESPAKFSRPQKPWPWLSLCLSWSRCPMLLTLYQKTSLCLSCLHGFVSISYQIFDKHFNILDQPFPHHGHGTLHLPSLHDSLHRYLQCEYQVSLFFFNAKYSSSRLSSTSLLCPLISGSLSWSSQPQFS